MESWLSILGSIASICGALWALYEAKQAANSASKAEVLRNEMVQRRKLVEVTQVHSETSRILKVISRIGPSCDTKLIRGVNCAEIAKEVEEYSRFINEQSGHFTNFFENQARKLCNELKDLIEHLAEAKTSEQKKAAGKEIYYKINNFMPDVKRLYDAKKERAIEELERESV